MEMSVDCLMWARPESLERLARSLRVTLPPRTGARRGWQRRWAYALIAAMDLQRAKPAAEERSDGQGGSGEGGGEDRGGDR